MRDLFLVLPKLAVLLPRLGSNHDAEVVATVRHVERLLKSAGLDWHDLVAALSPPVVTLATRTEGARRYPAPRRPPGPTGTGHAVLMTNMAAYCCLHGMQGLGVAELRFAVGMADKLRRGHRLGPKQEERLRALYDRLRSAA